MPPHDHHDDRGSELSEMSLRVRALETILAEKGRDQTPRAYDVFIPLGWHSPAGAEAQPRAILR
jgi:hypothetical protein